MSLLSRACAAALLLGLLPITARAAAPTAPALAPAAHVHAARALARQSTATFNVTINFTGGLSPSQQAAFSSAEATWESIITGYAPGVSITGITIDASGVAIDGPGGTLGSAGPTMGVNQGGFLLATEGQMQFDTADLDSMEMGGTLEDVILHEMGHVLGIGTLWTNNGVYVNGTGQYTGAHGLAAYQAEFDPLASYVPVELAGGAGTANGHWDEVDGGAGATGITDSMGRDMRDELMTGWLNAPTFISDLTTESLRDIGFTVSNAMVGGGLPEPGTAALFAISAAALLSRRTRRTHPV